MFVSAGTDFHRFDRLMRWVQDWAVDHPEATVVVQHGNSTPPRGCENLDMLTIEEMADQLGRADVVVVSCGPGAVMAARSAGHKPVAVARVDGEAVDDHQVAFSRLLVQHDIAHVAAGERELHDLLDRAMADGSEFRCELPSEEPPEAAAVFGALVDRLVSGR